MIPFIKEINEKYINCFYCKNLMVCHKRMEKYILSCKKIIIDEDLLRLINESGDIIIESIEIIKHGILL